MNRLKPSLPAAALAALFAQLNQAQGATQPTLFRSGVGSVGSTPTLVTVGGEASSAAGPVSSAAGSALREQTLVNSREALARTTRVRDDIVALQNAARAAALAGANRLRPDLADVPNGLTPGGLAAQLDAAGAPVRWEGANLPTEATGPNARIQVSVTQTAAQALLQWQTFNVGKETDLKFDQSAGGADRAKWVVFNQVNDPSTAPSQILGSLTADGQVYVINKNGVIFGGSSQVNTRGLTVSALPLNASLVERGLLNNPDSQFLFSGLAQPAGANGTPAFTPEAPHPEVGRYGDVLVQAGAILQSALDSAGAGGRVALYGANVTNHGSILTPNGQTLLAAGLQIGVAAHPSADPSLRGLDAYVGAVASPGTAPADVYAGTVTHTGLIDTPRGNASLVGREIMVDGMIDSTTSVALNGRIDLNASYDAVANPDTGIAAPANSGPFLYRQTGTVQLGEKAALRILPELESTATVAATELALRSAINVNGRAIYLGKDSSVLAPNAVANFNAGFWSYLPANRTSTFINAGGQIYLDTGSLISVSGTAAVPVSVAKNFVKVELRGSELADSPVQRNSFLRGQTITVDLRETGVFNGETWVGTPLADASGFIGLVERGIGELTTAAGEIKLNAGGSVVAQSGSRLDVSAGWLEYQGAEVSTTRLVRNGRIVDIADARPDVAYESIYTGVVQRTSSDGTVLGTYPILGPGSPRFEPGYAEGAAGGSVAITAAAVALDGDFVGLVSAGPRQRDTLPAGSSLSLKLETRDTTFATFPVVAPNKPTLTFQTASNLAAADAFGLDPAGLPLALRDDRVANVHLSPELFTTSGFGEVAVLNHGGDILLPESVQIAGPVGASLSLGAANLYLDGSIHLPGGEISLTAYNVTYEDINRINLTPNKVLPVPAPERGDLLVGAGAVLSTAGLVIDESSAGDTPPPAAINAGAISLVGHDVVVGAGATLDVSGGVVVSAAGRIRYGNAGSLTLAGGRDPAPLVDSVLGGSLSFEGARLLGHAGTGTSAGSLTLRAPLIQVGGDSPPGDTLLLAPEFFSSGGFSTFVVSGIGAGTAENDVYRPGLVVADGAHIRPEVENLVARRTPHGIELDRLIFAEGVRQTTNLTLSATGARDPNANPGIVVRGEVEVGTNSRIETDARGRIVVSANAVAVQGSLVAPGGRIEVRGGSTYATNTPNINAAVVTTLVGETATLDVSGKYVPSFNAFGLRTGNVLAGGSITVGGNVLASAGAELRADGASAVLDLTANRAPDSTGPGSVRDGTRYVPVRVDSNGGNITLQGGQLLASAATLGAKAGGADAGGGTLSVSSGRFYVEGDTSTTADVNLTISQSGAAFDQASAELGSIALAPGGAPLAPGGHFTADAFLVGGFDHLRLGGNVLFSGPVEIAAAGSLRVSTAGVIESTDSVRLSGAHVALGQDFRPPVEPGQDAFLFTQNVPNLGTIEYTFAPAHGTGSLLVDARHIDLGTLALQNFGQAEFSAPSGDIRGNGYLNLAGDLVFSAGQLYPTTATSFTASAFDYVNGSGVATAGTLTVIQSGNRPDLPASAGGTLNLHASEIFQNGTVRAPFGVINLGRDSAANVENPLTGGAAPNAETVTLGAGSLSSVSALRADGSAAALPYGVLLDGVSWIDPRGIDITLGGLTAKAVNLAAADIATEAGSVIDTRGGGDLFAYRFVPGTGGTTDILAQPGRFAIVPGPQPVVAPSAPYNPTPSTGNLGGDAGYTDASLAIGDQVFLSGFEGLPSGNYTLLPARYALLPGAFLVTPSTVTPAGALRQADGSSLVSGYRVNGLTGATAAGRVLGTFEVAPRSVVVQRAEYQIVSANTFLADAAEEAASVMPRLPIDAGRLAFSATRALELSGSGLATAPAGGRGSQVDISSSLDIMLAGPSAAPVANALILDPAVLGQFGAASLLIGGFRTATPEGDVVTTTARNLTVDNAGSALVGTDLVLVARENLTLAGHAEVRAPVASVTTPAVEPLLLGDAAVAGSGNGALLRVASGATAPIARSGVGTASAANLTIGENVSLLGGSLVADSSAASSIAASATLQADSLALNSGRISLVLSEDGDASSAGGLVLAGESLDSILLSARNLSLLSYTTLDLFGSGTVGSAAVQSIGLSAPALRHFGSGDIEFRAAEIRLDNVSGRGAPAALVTPSAGTLAFVGQTVRLGAGTLALDGFSATRIDAASSLLLTETGGLRASGDLALRTPLVTASTGATQALDASGALTLSAIPATGPAPASAGLGARLALSGASVALDGSIRLPSGEIVATARAGDLTIGQTAFAQLDVSGTAQVFRDLTRVTDAGKITLAAAQGDVVIATGSTVDVSAASAGGQTGALSITTPNGAFVANGTLRAEGHGGAFTLDTIALPFTGSLDARLNTAGFSASRELRVRTGDVVIDGLATATTYELAADAGSVTVTGTINASGPTGGTIDLRAAESLSVVSGARLNVSGQEFSAAGKGGGVALQAGAAIDGVVSSTARLALEAGSVIDLSVANRSAADAARGRLTGTLALRAPLTADGADVRIDPLSATVVDPSHISIEGFRLYDLTATNGVITAAVQNQVRSDAAAFLGTDGTTIAGYTAMRERLLAANGALSDTTVLRPGAEIIHRTGDLVLGATSSTATADWNLATYRFGPDSAPGALTLRAAGDLVFFNALSDGFDGGSSLWLSPLLAYNAALPANLQTWDLRLAAGADFAAADFRATRPLNQLSPGKGNILIGKNTGAATVSGGNNARTATLIANNFQVIRTGSGDIDLAAARDIRLLNPFAAIYTAGTAVPDATTLFTTGDFSIPLLVNGGSPLNQGSLGSAPQVSTAQYSFAGGDVTLEAGHDIARFTRNTAGTLIADSSRQLPNNWLYRRGVVDASGNYGSVFVGNVVSNVNDPSASTSWWVDFTNFFSDVGALGGGDVTLRAGRDVANVNVSTVTNARAASGQPSAERFVELGGGNVSVNAGRNIDGGVFYVQRGEGVLRAGEEVTTNATRSANLGILASLSNPQRLPEDTWMPTTLLVGESTFDVSARGDVLLGPIGNPHLLPQGNGNRFWYKTYFSTYGTDAGVTASSLSGDLTLRGKVTPNTTSGQAFLFAWIRSQNLLSGNGSAAFFQPWLRLAESSIDPFGTLVTTLPPRFRATAFSGDIRLAGDFNLFPSASGTIELLAADAIDGLSITGQSNQIQPGRTVSTWGASRINLSDAAPSSLPGVFTPLAYISIIGSSAVGQNNVTGSGFLQTVNRSFAETGATNSVLQTRQTLHAPGLLHRDDPHPVYLYALDGDISGLTLFSAKPVRIAADRDITDIAFYIQNNRADQFSLVSAGRDIVAYAPNSALRVQARSEGNALNFGEAVLSGDIQISGPGSLQVIAGRNLDLGVGPSGNDGTFSGITAIGNVRNPFLPQQGADLLLAAGVGPGLGLDQSELDFPAFIAEFLNPAGGELAERYLKELASLLPGGLTDTAAAWAAFQALPSTEQAQYATEIFHLVLRDVGRDYGNPESPNFRSYTLGYEAIETLFPGDTWAGELALTARQVATTAGGNISLLVPGGGVAVGLPVAGARPDQGILTAAGGNITIFTSGSVDVGSSRIFTLRGGDISIWSSEGDIAAGTAAKTVRSAPPTRVIIDPQSAAVETDLSGLATGGGIGALATVPGLPPSNITLVAPAGTIDAGDAGIRSSGQLAIAAAQVINAGNIAASGGSSGVPAPAAPSINVGSVSAASAATVASGTSTQENRRETSGPATEVPASFIRVEVLGFGGDEEEDDEEKVNPPDNREAI